MNKKIMEYGTTAHNRTVYAAGTLCAIPPKLIGNLQNKTYLQNN
jgi:hypothetical protein